MIDGQPRLSCLCLAGQVSGSEITTVEGLADGAHLAPIQACFAKYGGSQCGFCTPGFLIASQALLEENPSPTDDEIAEAIEGNLCRCTGYQQIIESIKRQQKYTGEKLLGHNRHQHLIRILIQMVRANHLCHQVMRSEIYVSRISSTTW